MRFSPYQTTRTSTVVHSCRLNPRYHCTTKPCIVGPYNICWTTADDRFFCIILRYREAAYVAYITCCIRCSVSHCCCSYREHSSGEMRFSPYQTTRSSTVVCCCRLNPRYHCTTKPCIVGHYNICWTTADDRFFCIIDRYCEAAYVAYITCCIRSSVSHCCCSYREHSSG